MDIDNLFKVPKLPLRGTKRKMPDRPTPEILKRMKIGPRILDPGDEDVSGGDKSERGKRRAPAIEDVEDEDAELGFAPGGDADYFVEEDNEGRFFGGGLTSEQKEILSIFENAGEERVQDDSEVLSITAIRRLLLRLERAVNKNQDLRSKFPDDPTKFIDSEADLDAALKALLPLAQVPVLAYPELIRSNAASLLIGLLAHENADVVIDVVEVIHELTDEDLGNEGDNEAEESTEKALQILIEGLLEHSILELLVDNLPRLNENEESDRQGVFHILGIFENVLSFNPQLSAQLVENTSLMTWLLDRIQAKVHGENRGYAAELLSILLQDNEKNRLEFGKKDGVEVLLKTLSPYRRQDPVDTDETEFMDNLFDCLCSALNEPSIKSLFLSAEGPDLMILMMKREKLQCRSRSIKVLDYAMSGVAGSAICEAFIEVLGLKSLFSALMGKKKKTNIITPASEETAHVLGVISSLFSNIPSDSPSRIRLLAKFVESNYEKVDKLLEIRDSARTKLKATDSEIDRERQEVQNVSDDDISGPEATRYLRRLDGGLFTLQTVDYILAWIIMEDDGIRAHALQMLDRKNQSLQDIIQTLRIFYSNVDDAVELALSDGLHHSLSQKEILQQLINVLDGSSLG